jgi:hypothetical protein
MLCALFETMYFASLQTVETSPNRKAAAEVSSVQSFWRVTGLRAFFRLLLSSFFDALLRYLLRDETDSHPGT